VERRVCQPGKPSSWRERTIAHATPVTREGYPPNAVAPVSLLSPPALPSDAGDWIPRSRKCTLSWLVLAFLFRAAPRTQEDSSLNGKTTAGVRGCEGPASTQLTNSGLVCTDARE
jgi:hypothetical protein